jgi:acetyl-CoA acetyltransferase
LPHSNRRFPPLPTTHSTNGAPPIASSSSTGYPNLDINHIHHAGNSSGIVDGAAAVLLASPEYSKKHGLKAHAKVVAIANMGGSPTLMLNSPVPATRKVRAKAGLDLDDIDRFEVNEDFGVVPEKYMGDLKLDRDKANVNGGAIALGHPIGATGLDPDRNAARRTRMARFAPGARYHVRRRRYGAGDHHRAGVTRAAGALPAKESAIARCGRTFASDRLEAHPDEAWR